MPYKRKKNGKLEWVGQIQIKGKRFHKICSTRSEAKEWEIEFKKAVKSEQEKTATVFPRLIEWANSYLDYSERYSPKTYSEKRNCFKRFLKSIDSEMTVDKLTPSHVLSFLQAQFKARSGYAANKERKNLVAAWNWGIKYYELPAKNPCLVDRFPEKRKPRYVPPESDFWKVYEVAQGQDRLLLLAFLHTAARRGELYRLRWADVDFPNRRIRLTTKKRMDGSEEHEDVPLTDDLFAALAAHGEPSQNEHVFVQSVGRHKGKPYTENRGFPQELCRQAEVPEFGVHAIRHLTASILAKNDVPMVTIQRILRHKKLATTERYIRGLESVRPHLEVLSGGLKKAKAIA